MMRRVEVRIAMELEWKSSEEKCRKCEREQWLLALSFFYDDCARCEKLAGAYLYT